MVFDVFFDVLCVLILLGVLGLVFEFDNGDGGG